MLSCKQKIKETDISNLNGYWEIEKVDLPDGDKKEYKVNTTIDFFEIKGKKGFRKKVMPQLDGSYLMNDLSESIEVVNREGDIILNYATPYAKWKEEIIELSDILPEDKITDLRLAFKNFKGESLGELKDLHGEAFSWDELRLFKASLKQ